MTEPYIHDRLVNWGKWARNKPQYGHCLSIEHRYRSPQCWWPEEPRNEIDLLDALRVERVMRHLPDMHRAALRYKYVIGIGEQGICNRLRVKPYLWGFILSHAQLMVRNLLTSALSKSRLTENLSRNGASPNSHPVGGAVAPERDRSLAEC